MRGLVVLFRTAPAAKHGLGLTHAAGNSVYAIYNSLVYLLALPGGWIADRIWGARRSVLWGGLGSGERPKLAAFVFFFVGATVFWMIYDQSGSQLNLFAEEKTNLSVFGWQMPSVWLQSANPFYIIAFAPLLQGMLQRAGEQHPQAA